MKLEYKVTYISGRNGATTVIVFETLMGALTYIKDKLKLAPIGYGAQIEIQESTECIDTLSS